MRIARFVSQGDPTYGVVELAEDQGPNPETIAVVSGDPLAGPVHYTGERLDLADVRLVSPVIPRSKVLGIVATTPNMPPSAVWRCRPLRWCSSSEHVGDWSG